MGDQCLKLALINTTDVSLTCIQSILLHVETYVRRSHILRLSPPCGVHLQRRSQTEGTGK